MVATFGIFGVGLASTPRAAGQARVAHEVAEAFPENDAKISPHQEGRIRDSIIQLVVELSFNPFDKILCRQNGLVTVIFPNFSR